MKQVLERYSQNQQTRLPAGTVLLAEGGKSGKLFVLADGSVEVLRRDTLVTVVNEPGAIFGEMSVLLDVPHTATVRTLEPSAVYVFDDAGAFMRSNPEIATVIARSLAQRLNLVTTYLVDLKRQYAGQANHLGMVSDVLASLVNQQRAEFIPGSDRQPGPGP